MITFSVEFYSGNQNLSYGPGLIYVRASTLDELNTKLTKYCFENKREFGNINTIKRVPDFTVVN